MSATISIRTDSELKKDFEVFCKSVGMNSSTALTIFMKKVVAEKRIPFEETDIDYKQLQLNMNQGIKGI